MRIEDVIGARVALRRQELGLSQQQLGERLDRYLGRTWTRQAVSAAERGGRDFIATELVALALALEIRPGYLLLPTEGEVELPSGRTLNGEQITNLFVLPPEGGEMSAEAVRHLVTELTVAISQAFRGIHQASAITTALRDASKAALGEERS